MVASKEIVTNVVTSLEDSRQTEVYQLESEFEASNVAITDLIEAWKRKIMQTGSISNYERAKTGRSRKSTESQPVPSSMPVVVEKENSHPNANASMVQTDTVEVQKGSTSAPGPKLSKRKEEPEKEEEVEEEEPEEELDVKSMKVVELRKHLRQRNLGDQGLKKDLQLRLQNDIDEKKMAKQEKLQQKEQQQESVEEVGDEQLEEVSCEVEENEETDVDMNESVTKQSSSDEIAVEVGKADESTEKESAVEGDVSMEDVNGNDCEEAEPEPDVEMYDETEPVPTEVETESQAKAQVQAIPEENRSGNGSASKSPKKNTIGKKILKATSKLFSPGKSKKSPKKMMKKENDSLQQQQKQVSFDSNSGKNTTANGQFKETTTTTTTTTTSNKPAGEVPRVTNEEPKESRSGSSSSGAHSTASVSSSTNEMNRQQHVPMPISTPAMSKMKTGQPFSSSTALAKKRELEEARKARLEKFRSDAKKKFQESSMKSHQPTSAMKYNTSTSSQDSAEERKKATELKLRQKLAASNKPQISAVTPVQQPMSSSATSAATGTSTYTNYQKQKALSPMDTYEMSDREESDSGEESDEHEYKSSNKKIPKWALKNNLLPALEKQFINGPDPDKIFQQVSSCDLEAIFGERKKQYRKRASTGNWKKDGVTREELDAYRKTMNYR